MSAPVESRRRTRPLSRPYEPESVVPRELQDLPPTLTVEQAAKLLGVGRNQTYEAVAKGELPAMRIGRRWVIPTVRLLRLLGVGVDDAGQSRVARRAAR
jgi:excisionase family DNA binding protein